MKSKFFGINAKLALAMLAVCSTVLTSCYEKEEVDVVIPTPVPAATYSVAGSIYDVATNVAITPTTITITGAEEAVTTPASSFKVKVKADATVTITVAKDGYYTATRTVYVGTAVAGTTNIINADIAMTSLTAVPPTSEGEPETAPEKDFTAGDLDNLGIPNAKEEVTFTDGKATIFSMEEKSMPAILISDYVSVEYNKVVDGVILTDVKVGTTTRAITTVDAATLAMLGKAVASKLNTPYLGEKFSTVKATANVWQIAGKAVIGLIADTRYELATLIFNINGKKYTVTYMSAKQQGLSFAYDTHDSHDSHDSHDGHGGATNAGGGSGSSK